MGSVSDWYMEDTVRDGEKITIVGDGEQRRDFTHVVDIVDALYKVGMGTENTKMHGNLELVNYSINEMFGMFLEKFPQIESVYLWLNQVITEKL